MAYTLDFHDKISSLSISCFNSLSKAGKPTKEEWTILSTIVQKSKSDLKVVALATGSKCIGKNSMSEHGDVLNDSHAEVLCRRAFLRYIYTQFDAKDSIFVISGNKYILSEDVTFHFFTTHVPCGDASIFAKNDSENVGCVLTNSNDDEKISAHTSSNDDYEEPDAKKRRVEDIYRTGAKCLDADVISDPKGEGANYHITGAVRTKPGRGDPTLSLSCSDKIAKWCFLGIQGSLLSILLEKPIYLSTFTVAGSTPFDATALNRAFYDRFTEIELTEPYKLVKMEAAQANQAFTFCKDNDKRPCPSSIIYFHGNDWKVEVAVEGRKHGLTKKALLKRSSLLKVCKLELFRTFMTHAKNVPSVQHLQTKNYINVKKLAVDYMHNWQNVKNTLFKVWTQKSETLLQFDGS